MEAVDPTPGGAAEHRDDGDEHAADAEVRWGALSQALHDQRAALEHVAFKLEEQLLVVSSGRSRWLPAVTREVQEAFAALEACDTRRAQLVARITEELNLGGNPTLGRLADLAGGEWRGHLHTQRSGLLEVLGGVQELLERNRELIARHLSATSDALAAMGVTSPSAYGPAAGTGPGGAVLLDTRA